MENTTQRFLAFSILYSILFLAQLQISTYSFAEIHHYKEGLFLGQSDLKQWLEGKKFKNRDTGLTVQYGYIGSLNTYGFTFTNSYNNKFHFMNCSSEIAEDQSFGVFTECLNPADGTGFGRAKVYKASKKIVIGDSSGEFTYYLVEN